MHDSLAISICNELLSDPESSDVRVYSRILSLLRLTPSNTVRAACVCMVQLVATGWYNVLNTCRNL